MKHLHDIIILMLISLLIGTIVLTGVIFFMFIAIIPLNYIATKHKVWVIKW